MASAKYILTTCRPLNILITGGSHGIGRGLLQYFLRIGHSILILDSNEDELVHISRMLPTWPRGGGGRCIIMNCDLRSRNRIKEVVRSARTIFDGKLDILINIALRMPHTLSNNRYMDELGELMMEQWDAEIAASLTGPFLLSRLCIPLLQAGGTQFPPGCIINIPLTRAYQPNDNHAAYYAAMGGLIALTQSMAISLGHTHKIRVNAILPLWINIGTENENADEKPTKRENGSRQTNTGRYSESRLVHMGDLIKVVQYLVSSRFVTGQKVIVNGVLE
jgi:NAD(P)-dependent dehydrogenase (short-subunit alcohol dehydrogenase family)